MFSSSLFHFGQEYTVDSYAVSLEVISLGGLPPVRFCQQLLHNNDQQLENDHQLLKHDQHVTSP